jgi:hypothetical protein
MRRSLLLAFGVAGCGSPAAESASIACDAPVVAQPVCDCAFTLSWPSLGADVSSVDIMRIDEASPLWDGEALCVDDVQQADVVSSMSWITNGATSLTFDGGLDASCLALPSPLPAGAPTILVLRGASADVSLVLLPQAGGPDTIVAE